MKERKIVSFVLSLAIVFALFGAKNFSLQTGVRASDTSSWENVKRMTNAEAVERLLDVCLGYRTVYVNATFGHTLEKALSRSDIMASGDNNKRKDRYNEMKDHGFFTFDCSGFLKSVLLWGWKGDYNLNFGGATYVAEQDINQDGFKELCNMDSNFENIVPGEFLFKVGHCGIYIGNGYAVECTPEGTDENDIGGVMITQVENMITDESQRDHFVKSRTWDSHGKLPFIYYGDTSENGIKLSLDKYAYSPGEPISITIEGMNDAQYTNSRIYIYRIMDYSNPNDVELLRLNRWIYVSNGSHTSAPIYPPASPEGQTINAANYNSKGELVDLMVGDYMIVVHQGDASSPVLAKTTFRVSYPRIHNATYVEIPVTGTYDGEEVNLTEGWIDFTTCGDLMDRGGWVGVYNKNTQAYGATTSIVWHYANDYLTSSYDRAGITGYDNIKMRIEYKTSSPENLKVVLFLGNGYYNVDECNINKVLKAVDKTVNSKGAVGAPQLTFNNLVESGGQIFIDYNGVTEKDAWIALTYTDEVYSNTTGMWCYASTGKLWPLFDESNIVGRGRVVLSANTLDENSGLLHPLPTGNYLIVLYKDGGFVPLVKKTITIIK